LAKIRNFPLKKNQIPYLVGVKSHGFYLLLQLDWDTPFQDMLEKEEALCLSLENGNLRIFHRARVA